MACHQPLKALLIVLNLVVLIITVIFATIATVDEDSKIFDNQLGHDVGKNARDTEVMPSRWTFQIWIIIYLWQFLWIFYTITLIFRTSKSTQDYLYVDPAFLPASFYGIFILHLVISLTWLFAYDNEYHVASFVGLATMAFTLYVCTFFAVYLLWYYQEYLSVSEMWANIILLHNGLGIYASWSTVAALLAFRTMLVETFDIKGTSAATVVLVILLLIVLVYSVAEMWISKKRLRYMITPYLTTIVALIGIIDGHDWDDDSDSANAILKIVLMAVLLIITLTKFGVTIFRVYRQPTKIDKSCKC